MGLCVYIKKENFKWESQIFSAYEFCILSFEEKGIKKKGKHQNRHQSPSPPYEPKVRPLGWVSQTPTTQSHSERKFPTTNNKLLALCWKYFEPWTWRYMFRAVRSNSLAIFTSIFYNLAGNNVVLGSFSRATNTGPEFNFENFKLDLLNWSKTNLKLILKKYEDEDVCNRAGTEDRIRRTE